MLPLLAVVSLFGIEGAPGVSFDVGSILTGTGFGALVWYLITKAIPKQQDDFIKALASERESFTNELRAERELRSRLANDFNQTVLRMVGLSYKINPTEAAKMIEVADKMAAASRLPETPEKT